jgi:hypothetical protein
MFIPIEILEIILKIRKRMMLVTKLETTLKFPMVWSDYGYNTINYAYLTGTVLTLQWIFNKTDLDLILYKYFNKSNQGIINIFGKEYRFHNGFDIESIEYHTVTVI